MDDPNVLERMRADWNERAGEDANYYVAFGRREQEEAEFFATGGPVIKLLEMELARLPGRDAALEIGCGPGRLMRPLSRHFREIHGIDVSDAMIKLARERLRDTPNAFPQPASGSDLKAFPDDKFDFVYSYAVFQHIPSADVVRQYLRESRRVLKTGGILRCQINGLPQTAKHYDTWSGVRFTPEEIRQFALDHDFQLLALEMIDTQYMWVTCRKRPTGWVASLAGRRTQPTGSVRSLSNALTGEAVVPAAGPLSALSLWMKGLPDECDLNHMTITVDGRSTRPEYIGVPANDSVQQVNVRLPKGIRTGIVPVEMAWLGQPICPKAWVRVIPPGPAVARLTAVTDGVNLLLHQRTESGSVKVNLVEVPSADLFHATVDSLAVREVESFCADPMMRRYEFNFRMPEGMGRGYHVLRIAMGKQESADVARGGVKYFAIAVLAAFAVFLILPVPRPRLMELPAGRIDVHHEILVASGMELRGAASGTVLHAAPDFDGRALVVVQGDGVTLRNFSVDGNRAALERRTGLPPSNKPFSQFTVGNGVLAVGVARLRIADLNFHDIAGFAVLVSRSRDVRIERIAVANSGSRDARGRNNSTGGVLLEEGTRDFRVTRSEFRNISGNGVWTHSLFTSPRNADGEIAFNLFEDLARDAIQVGHATNVRVEDNRGTRIGYPPALVDLEDQAYPVALDTAGDVDHTVYARNSFTEVDGKCIDLDGFHDGDVIGNSCVNRPDASLYPYGNIGILFNDSNPHTRSTRIRVIGNLIDGAVFTGIYAFGTGHTITHNRLLNVNLAHCNEEAAKSGCYYPKDEPDALQTGIYLGRGFLWREPSRDIVVEDNEVSGFAMKSRCIGYAPDVDREANKIHNNRCQ